MTTVLEAYDLLRFADQYGEKLAGALAELEARPDVEREVRWLGSAVEMIDGERAAFEGMAGRLRMLPEMSSAREEHAAAQIGPFVDALEKLLAGITFHFGSRAPVIEALYPHQRLGGMRRGNLEEVRAFWADFERRLKSSYVERIFAQDEYAFAREVVGTIRAAYAAIGASAEVPQLSEAERASIAEAVIAAGRRAERAIAQARLIAEAALLPFEGLFLEAGLNAKPKKKAAKVSESDLPAPVVEEEKPAEVSAEPAVPEDSVPEAMEEKPAPKKKRAKKGAAAEDAQAS